MGGDNRPDKGRVIAILGMHRSGTSCLTGSLQQAGLTLGEVHTWNRYNLRGNREQQTLVDLNDEVLADNGGSWDRPPKHCQWSDEQLRRAQTSLMASPDVGALPSQSASSPGSLVRGFKDPRTLLTLDGWLRAIPQLEFVGVFRSPLAVARSLAHRSAMPPDQALELWALYNRRLLRLWRRYRFPLVNFDVEADDYLGIVSRVARDLGLDAEASRQAPFFDESLRTSQADPVKMPLPYSIRLLHWRLRRAARVYRRRSAAVTVVSST